MSRPIALKLTEEQAELFSQLIASITGTPEYETCGGRAIPEPNDVYQHYKGGKYLIYDVVTNATNGAKDDRVVIYKKINTSKVYARELEEFLSEVEVDGKKLPRFEYLGKDDE